MIQSTSYEIGIKQLFNPYFFMVNCQLDVLPTKF